MLVLAQAEDNEKHDGVAHVNLDLADEGRSSLENFDPTSLTNMAEDIMEDGDGWDHRRWRGSWQS